MSSNRLPCTAFAVSGCAALFLTACATSAPPPGKVANPATPTEQYALRAAPSSDEMLLALHMDLSQNQQAALAGFAGRWSEEQGGDIVVLTPDRGGEPASRTGRNIGAALLSLGVPPARVRLSTYDGEPGAPARVGYARFEAVVDKCNQSWGNLTSTRKNQAQQNFGCTVTANRAAQIANPADIDHPRAMDPADGQRRATVFDKYRKGDVTSSHKDSQASGYVSKVVQ